MESFDERKLMRLIRHVGTLVSELRDCSSFSVKQRIDDSFYMQREAELQILKEQLEEARKRALSVESKLIHYYNDTYHRWRTDVRWVKRECKKSKES